MKDLRLQDKLGKQNFHFEMKRVLEPVTKACKETAERMTKTIEVNREETS